MVAVKDQGCVRLVSRNSRDHTRRFPDIVAAGASLKPTRLILDGEVVVFDQDFVSRFEWLRHLNHGELATPPILMALPARRFSPDGFAAWTEVVHRGWEGYVAKDPASPTSAGDP